MTLSIAKLCHYAECHCAECRNLFIGMLNVVMLSVIRLSVVRLNVIMLSAVAPFHPGIILAGKARSLPKRGEPQRYSPLAGRLGLKGLPRANVLAY